MTCRRICIGIISAVTSISVSLSLAQAPADPTPQHEIVPLAAMGPNGRVSGNPDKAGAQYVIRIPNDANQIVFPHWHPEDENIVVVKGTWYMGMGDKFDRRALREMNVGDYALVPKHSPHFAWSKTGTIIQVHGIGPFQVIPVNEWDQLSGGKIPAGDPKVQDFETAPLFQHRIGDRIKSKYGEGLVVGGTRSSQNNITQYNVQTDDGRRFYALEEDLTVIPMSQKVRAALLTGAWRGLIHGLPGGDAPCTFYVRQDTETITGVLAVRAVGVAFDSSTFRNDALEIHIASPFGKFLFNGEYKAGFVSGTWSSDSGLEGTWEGKKIASNR